MSITCDLDVYSIGDAPLLTATFTDVDGTPADPTTVVFTVTPTHGSALTGLTAVHGVTGTWTCQLPVLSVSDTYRVKVVGAGVLAAVSRGEFTVLPD